MRLGGRVAGDLRLGQVGGVLQFVFAGAYGTLDETERGDGVVDGRDGRGAVAGGGGAEGRGGGCEVGGNAGLSLFLYQVLTQVWCKANGLWNSRGEQTSAEQFEARATVHLPLERFQPVDVTFYRTIAE